MSPEYVFIAILLTSSWDPPKVEDSGYTWPALQKAGQQLMQDWDFDVNKRQSFKYEAQFQYDIKDLREATVKCAGLPHSSYREVLPSNEVIREAKILNRKYRNYIMHRLLMEKDREEILYRALYEAKKLYCAWELADTARSDYQGAYCVRDSLGQLGAHRSDFQMPPPIPYWRIEEAPTGVVYANSWQAYLIAHPEPPSPYIDN